MTYLITPIAVSNVEKAVLRAEQALAAGAGLVEVRLDYFEELSAENLARLDQIPRGKWIATLRSKQEGGQFAGSNEEWSRVAGDFARLGVGYLDVEVRLLRGSDKVRAALHELSARAPALRLIVSAHEWQDPPSDIRAWLSEVEQLFPNAIHKLAWTARSSLDAWVALELMAERPGRRMLIPMGFRGFGARVLATKCAAFGTFCAIGAGEETAPGQVTLAEARDLYRIHTLTAATEVYGVIGWPVGHSLSPLLFNTEFAATGRNAVYLPMAVETEAELIALLDRFRQHPECGVRGLSVTVPHKEAAFRWCGDRVDPRARAIGAVNTVRFNGGVAEGFNTDQAGALGAFSEQVPGLRGLTVAVLGAGGVARAVVSGLAAEGAKVTIYNRSAGRAEQLAREFGVASAPWESRGQLDARVVVNCTSIGMHPEADQSPLARSALRPGMVVFDTIYNPLETRLLADARAAGCQVISGLSMFVRQAACQYRLWTDSEPDTDRATACVTKALTARHTRQNPG